MVPVRRLGAQGKVARRKRIFARLREGAGYEEIAGEEGASRERIRQIVSDVLQKPLGRQRRRSCEAAIGSSRARNATGGRSGRRGDVAAIEPYLKVLDRFDRCQTVAGANQVYDDEARKKLLDEINRIADNLGVDEVMAAAREHLEKIGEIPDDEPGEAEGGGREPTRRALRP
jgi:hypothetical protein